MLTRLGSLPLKIFNVLLINGFEEEIHRKCYKFVIIITLIWVVKDQDFKGMRFYDFII